MTDRGEKLSAQRRTAARHRERGVFRRVRADVDRLRGDDAIARHALGLLAERNTAGARPRQPLTKSRMARTIERFHAHHEIVLQRERREEQRGVDAPAAAGALAPIECCGHAEGQQRGRHVVGDRRLARGRQAVLDASAGHHQTGAALHDEIHPGERGVRAARAERRDVADDDAWMPRGQLLVLEAELGGQARPHVREHDVGAREQRVENRARVAMPQVEWQRVLAAVADEEVAALTAPERRDVAARLTLTRLDLDDVGAAVGENLARPRHGDEVAELDDRDARERLLAAHVGHPCMKAFQSGVAMVRSR
jgi:hypothetical protein